MNDKTSHQPSSPKREWAVSYTQNDVDMIREQIEEEEASKRRLLFLAFIVTAAALVGAVILLATGYSLYAAGVASKDRSEHENATLKSQAADCTRQLQAIQAKERDLEQVRSQATQKLEQVIPARSADYNDRDAATLAEMVYSLPEHEYRTERKPPDTLFRNWKTRAGETTSVYTLVGGYVDGKWVIYSDLISRR